MSWVSQDLFCRKPCCFSVRILYFFNYASGPAADLERDSTDSSGCRSKQKICMAPDAIECDTDRMAKVYRQCRTKFPVPQTELASGEKELYLYCIAG